CYFVFLNRLLFQAPLLELDSSDQAIMNNLDQFLGSKPKYNSEDGIFELTEKWI
ncbi:unnamed protein product, partial [Ceratitis capitata]